MPEKIKPKSFGWPFWLLLLGGIVILFGFADTQNKRRGKSAGRTEATSNLRQIGLALHEFEKQHGTFPNDETAARIRTDQPPRFNLKGTSSNALFRQLFAAGVVENETMFYAKFPGVSRPDNDISSGHLLEKSEVAFAYIAGLSTKDNPALPVAFGPVIPGTGKFDPKPFNRKGVVLRIDSSVSWFQLRENGDAMMGGGVSLLDPNNELWKGKAPDIRYPE
jgi:hypothetical protein